ncbi:MAG TPA: ribosome biogenesis GTP-binding protein YihA/YsxC [Clostridia bacterium]|nr:ribosome biogenesis GTP-binding protein YihA/YsxC [Clostridia bacterium]
MEILKSEFITSAVKPSQYPKEDLPYIALVGKSNVGKSSMLNTLTNRARLAKTSGQPGKTRLINFFRINDLFCFVDLPGYGFARVSQKEKAKWGDMIETFLTSSPNLMGMIQLVDIRHKPTDEDRVMRDWMAHYNMPIIIVATKADKLGKTRWKPQADMIRKALDLPEGTPVIPFSSQTRLGVDRVLSSIGSLLNNHLDLQD